MGEVHFFIFLVLFYFSASVATSSAPNSTSNDCKFGAVTLRASGIGEKKTWHKSGQQK